MRRLKRSTMKPCPECGERRYLDIKVDYGGARYIDLYAIECVWDSFRGPWKESEKDAIEAWNNQVDKSTAPNPERM